MESARQGSARGKDALKVQTGLIYNRSGWLQLALYPHRFLPALTLDLAGKIEHEFRIHRMVLPVRSDRPHGGQL